MGNACGGCCCAAWKELRHRENMNFDRTTSQGRVDYVQAFGTGRRWVSSPHKFLALRATLFLLMMSVLLWSISLSAIDNTAEYWLIYLTHWTLIIEVVYLGCALFTTATLRSKVLERLAENLPPTPGSSTKMPWYVQVTWMLRAVALPASFQVFLLYWLLVFPTQDTDLKAISCFTHGVNFIVMLVDGWLSRQPYLISHGIYFLCYCVIYVVWTIIHAVAKIGNEVNEDYIYASLDWGRNSGKATMYAIAVVIIAGPAVNLFFWWLLHFQRRYIDHLDTPLYPDGGGVEGQGREGTPREMEEGSSVIQGGQAPLPTLDDMQLQMKEGGHKVEDKADHDRSV